MRRVATADAFLQTTGGSPGGHSGCRFVLHASCNILANQADSAAGRVLQPNRAKTPHWIRIRAVRRRDKRFGIGARAESDIS